MVPILAGLLLLADCSKIPPSRASSDYWDFIRACGCWRSTAPPRASLDYDRWKAICYGSEPASPAPVEAPPNFPRRSPSYDDDWYGPPPEAQPRALGPTQPISNFDGQVIAVHDGDTLSVLSEGRVLKVRLQGIDAPEARQPGGEAARQALAAAVKGKAVSVSGSGCDRHGRTVARVYVGSDDLGLLMVRLGHAWWFQQFAPKDQKLAAAEGEARRLKRGLWSDPAPVAPWTFREAQAPR
jgi:endonuclease YncB( thermonuclease family)